MLSRASRDNSVRTVQARRIVIVRVRVPQRDAERITTFDSCCAVCLMHMHGEVGPLACSRAISGSSNDLLQENLETQSRTEEGLDIHEEQVEMQNPHSGDINRLDSNSKNDVGRHSAGTP